MFDGDYFVTWMGALLDELKAKAITNAVIVMDNAKYHKCLPKETPRYSHSKTSLQQACTHYGISFDPRDTKPTLWTKLLPIINAVEPVVCQMARAEGHEIVFTPPYHSDLQPIERVWAVVKGNVGRQYNDSTTFADVLRRLNDAFASLTSETVQGCIKKSYHCLTALEKHIKTIEAVDSPSDGSDRSISEDEND